MPEFPDPSTATQPIVRHENGELRLYFEDEFLQSRMFEDQPTRLVLEYTQFMMGFLLFQPQPQRIAMIGLGGGSLAKYCRAALPETDFTAVEISPEVITWRDTFGVPPDGPKFRVVCDDGAAFVRRSGELVDVLLVDGFDVDGLPPELSSPAFYDACRARLSDDGVLVANLHPDDDGYAICLDRLYQAFAGAVIVVTADESDNRIIFASPAADFPPSFAVLVERLRDLEPRHMLPFDVIVKKILQQQAPPPQKRRRRKRS